MNSENRACSPYNQLYSYLHDMKLREKYIEENLKMISLSRETIEKFLKYSEIEAE